MTGTAGSVSIRATGFAVLPATVDLLSTASGTAVDTGLEITLPVAGTYQLDAMVRAALTAGDGTNVWIAAHLYDVTVGAIVPNSEVIVHQLAITLSAHPPTLGESSNGSAPIMVEYTVPGPRRIRLRAIRVYTGAAPTMSRVQTDGNGRTTLRYERVG